jgi:hypothetical protein
MTGRRRRRATTPRTLAKLLGIVEAAAPHRGANVVNLPRPAGNRGRHISYFSIHGIETCPKYRRCDWHPLLSGFQPC